MRRGDRWVEHDQKPYLISLINMPDNRTTRNSIVHDWTSEPRTAEAWLDRAAEAAAILAEDAIERDRANQIPHEEIQLLRDSGLLTLLGPAEYGGGGQTWSLAYKVVREIARADGSIAQLLGYHYKWSHLPRHQGTTDQWERLERESTVNRWLWGGAANPRDADLVATDEGEYISFSGFKSFSTGGRVADVMVLEGVLDGFDDEHVFTVVPTDDDGFFHYGDWDNLGQRLTESGSIEIKDVRAGWEDALGWVDKVRQRRTYDTITLPTQQLVFVNMYLGIAQGAVEAAARYTNERTRAWLFADVDRAVDDPYILQTYGQFASDLAAVEALADKAGTELEAIHADPDALTERRRGEIAVLVAQAKIKSAQTSLDITSRLYEVLGARATANVYGFDRYWRNVRTHTLHDPVAYKLKEVGEYVLRGEIPEPSWYT